MRPICAEATLAARVAADYLQRGWSVVPVPFRSKAPVARHWQQLRITEADLRYRFVGRNNVGVLLGQRSRWLIDVDLDHSIALQLAPSCLPPTGSVFGRPAKRRSHWLYYALSPVATRQWRLPDKTKRMIVELRSTGGQTVFPGSIHPSGELIEWECDGEPGLANPSVLQDRLQAIYEEVCRRLGMRLEESSGELLSCDRAAPQAIIERARTYLSKVPPAVSGQGGHNATFHAACVLVLGFGLDRQAALTLLRAWNETCQPLWTERELAHKVDDALTQPGWRGYLLSRAHLCPAGASISAIERANRHAIEHRRRVQRRKPA